MQDVSRRDFGRLTATGAAAAGATSALLNTVRGLHADGARTPMRIGFLGAGRRCRKHIDVVLRLQRQGLPVETAAVCDVFNRRREEAAARIRKAGSRVSRITGDYREVIADPNIDTVCIATPDHWHARMTLDALEQGKSVYCEKPMTHTLPEAIQVVDAWKASGAVMQVGVQSASAPMWEKARGLIEQGRLGKVVQFQTEYFRNSAVGQWRVYPLTRDMTPDNIDWPMFLGSEVGLAAEMPFDRAVYAQWRRFWPFSLGMFSDLFVHRITTMLKATGLRFPARVVGAGGIYLEYDGRQVPDVATIVADFAEGVQGIVTATMCCEETPLRKIIRGHHGSIVFGSGRQYAGFELVAERRQVTRRPVLAREQYTSPPVDDATEVHWRNFIEAVTTRRPDAVHCDPLLAAAAVALVTLGTQSYREGTVLHFEPDTQTACPGDSSWADRWESRSAARQRPAHLPGWQAGDLGSRLSDPPHQQLEGPWIDGNDPA